MRLSIKPGLDDLKPFIQFVKQLGAKNTGKNKDVSVKNKIRTHKTNEHKDKKNIDFEIAGKSLIKNRARGLNVVASKNLVKNKARKLDGIIVKSLYIFIGSLRSTPKSIKIIKFIRVLRDVTKSETIIVKR